MLDKCSTTDILLFCLFSFVWGRAHAHHILPVGGGGGRGQSWEVNSLLQLGQYWSFELRLPGLVASTLTYRVTLPNLDFFFFIVSQGLTTLARLALESWSSFSASQAAGITDLQHKSGFCSLELWVYKYLLLMPSRPAFCYGSPGRLQQKVSPERLVLRNAIPYN